jgi:hypothetical protein
MRGETIVRCKNKITEQIDQDGNTSDLHSGGVQFDSRVGTPTEIFRDFPHSLQGKCRDDTLNQAMKTSFRMLPLIFYHSTLPTYTNLLIASLNYL